MRIVKELSINSIKITIFCWNNKYILKYEAGQCEQTYKWRELDITSEESVIESATSELFISKVYKRMEEMHNDIFSLAEDF